MDAVGTLIITSPGTLCQMFWTTKTTLELSEDSQGLRYIFSTHIMATRADV
jgi:hypothetical protein